MWVFQVTGPHPAATHPESPHQNKAGNSKGRGSVSGTRGGTNTYLSHSAGLSNSHGHAPGPHAPPPGSLGPWPGRPPRLASVVLPQVRCGEGRLAPATWEQPLGWRTQSHPWASNMSLSSTSPEDFSARVPLWPPPSKAPSRLHPFRCPSRGPPAPRPAAHAQIPVWVCWGHSDRDLSQASRERVWRLSLSPCAGQGAAGRWGTPL